MKKVLLITHHETSNLGIISKILSKKYLITSIYFKNIKNLSSNELLGYSAYIFFGGKMSANSQSEVINNEFIFLKKLIKSNKLIIGICLGAQLIAKIYGSKIYKNKNNLVEIGYRKLDKINEKFFKNVSSMLQFHNEGITYNSHMSIYAKGRNFEIDAFKIKKKKIYGFQFHPEVNESMIKNWYSNLSSLKKGTDSLSKILLDHKKNCKKNYKWLSNFLYKVI